MNGYIEKFNFSQSNDYSNVSVKQFERKNMSVNNGHLKVDGIKISDEDLNSILTFDEYETYQSARNQYSIGSSFIYSGSILFIVGTILYTNGILTNEYNNSIIGLSFGVTGGILMDIGIPFACISYGRLKWIAENYNNRIRTINYTLSFQPSLMSSPDNKGGNNYCYGLGITLSF